MKEQEVEVLRAEIKRLVRAELREILRELISRLDDMDASFPELRTARATTAKRQPKDRVRERLLATCDLIADNAFANYENARKIAHEVVSDVDPVTAGQWEGMLAAITNIAQGVYGSYEDVRKAARDAASAADPASAARWKAKERK